MKKNSVFNNFNSGGKYNSNQKANYSSRNGFLDTQTEFAKEFFEKQVEENDYQNQKREKNSRNNDEDDNK